MHVNELLVLVIEPSRMQRNIIVGQLRALGVEEIEEFTDASSALERMQSITPDVVISSMHLPDMTGSELVSSMRMSPQLSDVAFFLISSETLYRYLEPIRQAGATAILPKPFDPQELGKQLNSVIQYLADQQREDVVDADEFDHLRILIVDDSQMARHYIERILHSIGITNVREAKDGAEALQIMKADRFDLVITDYNMPNIDGLELVQHIRQYSDQPTIPVVVVTSEQNDAPLSGFKTAGVSAICRKPFSYEMIKKLIRHLVNDEQI